MRYIIRVVDLHKPVLAAGGQSKSSASCSIPCGSTVCQTFLLQHIYDVTLSFEIISNIKVKYEMMEWWFAATAGNVPTGCSCHHRTSGVKHKINGYDPAQVLLSPCCFTVPCFIFSIMKSIF